VIIQTKTTYERESTIKKNWAYGFVKRHPQLKIIKPENLDKYREKHSNWISLLPFYKKFLFLIEKRNYKPSLIFNIDEVSLSSSSNSKQLQVVIDDEVINSSPASLSLAKSSLLFTISADGSSLPSVVLLSQKNIPTEFISNERIRFIHSEHGWMTKQTLETIFQNILIPSVSQRRMLFKQQELPALFLVDGHTSRSSGKLFSMCILNNIDILCLPSHVSHIVQPLDKDVNANFKNTIRLYKNYNNIETSKQHRVEFFELLQKAVSTALTYSTIKHSWFTVGLNPFNPYKILCKYPILPPKYLSIDSDNNNSDSISGKILCISSLNYSFNNFHHLFHLEQLPSLQESLIINEMQRKTLEKFLSKDKENQVVTAKLKELKSIITQEKNYIQIIGKEKENIQEIELLNADILCGHEINSSSSSSTSTSPLSSLSSSMLSSMLNNTSSHSYYSQLIINDNVESEDNIENEFSVSTTSILSPTQNNLISINTPFINDININSNSSNNSNMNNTNNNINNINNFPLHFLLPSSSSTSMINNNKTETNSLTLKISNDNIVSSFTSSSLPPSSLPSSSLSP
jgi:hypothetical protein